MAVLIFIAIISVFIIYYIRKSNEKPKGMENIPYISGLPIAWAYLQGNISMKLEI